MKSCEFAIRAGFAILVILATYPGWRVLAMGLTTSELLQLRCGPLAW
jgi:hypothetical protein